MKYFLGIDGGGSETRAVVVDDTLQVIGRGSSGASNHYVTGAALAAEHCRLAADAALLDATRLEPRLKRDAVVAWGFGLAGVRRPGDVALMHPQLEALVSGRPWILDTDVAAAHSGAFGGRTGIVLSAGTGSICFGRDDAGERFYSDGWGPLLGDEGSGYWLGMEALRAVCRAADGRGPRTRLTANVFDALNIADVDQLVPLIYSPDFPREQMSRLAQLVFNGAENGDQVAIEIRERAVMHLGSAAAAVTRAMLGRVRERAGLNAPSAQEVLVTLRGGLFDDDFFRASVGYNIGERMIEMKRDFLPVSAWHIVKPQFDAAVGAALLAQKLVA